MEVDRRPNLGLLALFTAVVDVLGVVSLIIFFAVGGGPFGFLNDVANGAVGLLSTALAWLWVPDRPTLWSVPTLAAATSGGVVMVAGSILIIFDITGWYLAGLVSSVGSALIGIWLLISNRRRSAARPVVRQCWLAQLVRDLLALSCLVPMAQSQVSKLIG